MKDWIEDVYGVDVNLGYTRLREAVKAAWDAIPQSKLDELINSMPARMQAVIDAKGGPKSIRQE